MHTKKDFYRLLYAKNSADAYLESMFRYWYKKEYGKKPPYFNSVEIVGYLNDDKISVKFDNDDNHVYHIPKEEFYDKEPSDESIKMIFHSDYYDGPISGMGWYKGKKVWFQWDHEFLDCMRIFAIYELSEEEIADEDYWHALFRQHVGSHCDYGDREYVKCDNDQPAFFKPFATRKERDYTKNKQLAMLDETFLERKWGKEVDNAIK